MKDRQKIILKNKIYGWIWSLARFVLIFGLAFIILKPIFYKISVAFMSKEDLLNPAVSMIPTGLSLEYWKSAISQMQLPASLFYTLTLSLVVGIIQVISCTMVGYGLGRFRFRGRNIAFVFVILIMLVPTNVISTAQYIHFVFFGTGFYGKSVGYLLAIVHSGVHRHQHQKRAVYLSDAGVLPNHAG